VPRLAPPRRHRHRSHPGCSGLRTQFGLINDGTTFGLALLVIVVATLSKIVGVALPCMAFKIPPRMSVVIGVLMSCKG
jgi:Kef-type K+ transport system membrane component KefB